MDRTERLELDTGPGDALAFLQRLDTKTRGVAILDALADMIDRAGLKVGDRIPPEITLAEKLGVGRSTIREALNRWEGLGLIRRRRGAGTFLAAPVPTSPALVPTMVRLEGEAILRLIEVRRALEVAAVQKAALNATAEQRQEIDALCTRLLKTVNAGRDWHKIDAEFHGAIYDASANPLFGQILVKLDEALKRSDESPFGRKEFGHASFPPHRVLSDGVIKGDPDMAVRGIHLILDSVSAEIRRLIATDPGLA
jgi:GntR family transcriptional repressor for pyruvate dehydrogenase complex